MPVKRSSWPVTFRGIAEELAQAIFRGELRVGERLPTERELSRRFGVSVPVVREALRILRQQGLLAVRRGYGGGIFVAHPNTDFAQDVLRVLLGTRQISLRDIAEVRLIYEPEIARLAATRITDAELEKLQEVVLRQQQGLREDRQEEFNLYFHRLVAEAAKNPVLAVVMETVVSVLLPEVRRMRLDRESRTHIVDFHRRLYEALAARDGERAARIMAEHVAEVQQHLQRIHQRQFPEAGERILVMEGE
jgi:GntR family transcriptional repressor for pyruvate dehydrogenase complex